MSSRHGWGWQALQTACRSPDSWTLTDHSQISLTQLPTPPKCSMRAIMALINNLVIVYHQYCSSSYLDIRADTDRFTDRIHLRHRQNVWAHCYDDLGHRVAASNSYTHTTTCTSWVRFWGVRGHSWNQVDVIASLLRLTGSSNRFLHQFLSYTKCLSTLIWCPWAYSSSLTQLSTLFGSDFGDLGHLWSQIGVVTS